MPNYLSRRPHLSTTLILLLSVAMFAVKKLGVPACFNLSQAPNLTAAGGQFSTPTLMQPPRGIATPTMALEDLVPRGPPTQWCVVEKAFSITQTEWGICSADAARGAT